jgi:hypothetical protein
VKIDGKSYPFVEIESFNKKYLGTNNEGAVTSVAVLPKLLNVKTEGDKIFIEAKEGTLLKLWQGNPSYDKECFETLSLSTSFHLFQVR